MTVLRTTIGLPPATAHPFTPTSKIPRSDVQSAIEYTRSVAGGVTIVESATAPPSPTSGMLWFDLTSETLNAYVSAIRGWLDVSTTGSGGTSYSEGPVPPASPALGSEWSLDDTLPRIRW